MANDPIQTPTTTPAAGSVTTSALASGAVTPAKISAVTTDDFTFPRDVLATRNFLIGTTSPAPNAAITLSKQLASAAYAVNIQNGANNGNAEFQPANDAGHEMHLGMGGTATGNGVQDSGYLYTDGQDMKFYMPGTTSMRFFKTDFTAGNDIVRINSSGTAALEVNSTAQGFLPPQMTTTQKNAITSPTEGLVVYDLSLHALCVYNGSTWKTVTVS